MAAVPCVGHLGVVALHGVERVVRRAGGGSARYMIVWGPQGSSVSKVRTELI